METNHVSQQVVDAWGYAKSNNKATESHEEIPMEVIEGNEKPPEEKESGKRSIYPRLSVPWKFEGYT
jgi:hypothetical protein